MAHLEDDEYEIPLRDQRYFGAGIKRKRVQFVPSTSTDAPKTTSLPPTSSSSAAIRYLDIVLKRKLAPSARNAPTSVRSTAGLGSDGSKSRDDCLVAKDGETDVVCDICKSAVVPHEEARSHDSSITHQICLQHSYPPSHLDRRRKGLQVLSNHGWDPDSRLGLGAAGEGILHPIKAKENREKAGLGLKPEDMASRKVKERPVRLDAGKVRALESEKRKKGEKLRDAFYRSEDVERYLGDGGPQGQGVDLRAFKQARKTGLR